MVLDIVGEIIDSQIMHSKLFIFHAVYNVKQMEDLEPMKDYHLYFFFTLALLTGINIIKECDRINTCLPQRYSFPHL